MAKRVLIVKFLCIFVLLCIIGSIKIKCKLMANNESSSNLTFVVHKPSKNSVISWSNEDKENFKTNNLSNSAIKSNFYTRLDNISLNIARNVRLYESVLKRARSVADNVENIVLGAILPKTALKTVIRAYHKRLQDAVEALTSNKNTVYHFINRYQITQARLVLLSLNPTPTEILSALCDTLLPHNVTTIIYMSNSDTFGNNAASTQYLMQLTSYLGIPVIAWNPDNIGLEQRITNSLMLQLAPSVSHQAYAMLSLLRRYSWHSFSVLSTDSTGHEHFVRSLRDQMVTIHDYKYTIMDVFAFNTRIRSELEKELRQLAKSESRVYLLYCSKADAQIIFEVAKLLGLTKRNYVWIVSESIVGSELLAPASSQFPVGMLGIHFNTTLNRLLDEIERAVNIFGHGLEHFVGNSQHALLTLSSKLSCNETADRRWIEGEILFKHLRSVSIRTKFGKPNLEFNLDGTLKYVELDIMNLNSANLWEKIGVWNKDGLYIKDITWPENSPVPPPGVPEKFSLKVTFLEEPPFLNSMSPNNETGECKTSRSVKCRYAPLSLIQNMNKSLAHKNSKYYKCCSGFCIDLLQKFSQDLKFSFELYRVEDGNWGILNNGSWNGLIQELLEHKADMVVTSIKINSERQAYVDFTVPFLETGITIVVAKRTGIISPKAFLEPFDTTSWIMILLVSIKIAAFAIFIFEWMSPNGYNMSLKPSKAHKFSLFRTYWLVWAILFGAAVPINCPRGYTARFMSNVWATFAVVFLAIYTANLAAFMITREDFYDFSGIEDSRLANPTQKVPPLRFGTIPHGNTEAVLKRNKPRMHSYMKQYNTSDSLEGVKNVRNSNLDAFIYDAVVLDYMAGQDPDCRLLTVGSWYAMTGYGFAFPKNSKYLAKFNEKMIEYRENGDLERLRKFWFQGACKPTKDKGNLEGKLSNPLDINQFMSAFLLLGCGILLTIVLLLIEHFYFKFVRKCFHSKEEDPCFALISLSMAKSLAINPNKHASSIEKTFIGNQSNECNKNEKEDGELMLIKRKSNNSPSNCSCNNYTLCNLQSNIIQRLRKELILAQNEMNILKQQHNFNLSINRRPNVFNSMNNCNLSDNFHHLNCCSFSMPATPKKNIRLTTLNCEKNPFNRIDLFESNQACDQCCCESYASSYPNQNLCSQKKKHIDKSKYHNKSCSTSSLIDQLTCSTNELNAINKAFNTLNANSIKRINLQHKIQPFTIDNENLNNLNEDMFNVHSIKKQPNLSSSNNNPKLF